MKVFCVCALAFLAGNVFGQNPNAPNPHAPPTFDVFPIAPSVVIKKVAKEDVVKGAEPVPQKENQPLARPFSSSRPRTAEDLLDPLSRSSWLAEDVDAELTKAGLAKYRSAKNTQSIYVVTEVNGYRHDQIDRIPRASLLKKWQVPGGMEHSQGWSSQLYKHVPSPPKSYIADIPVKNSFGYFQNNRGWKREYPNGTVFVDALSKDGKVFELRVAEKKDGAWHRFVDYRDRSARPHGFQKISAGDCRSCHDEAGTGGYAVGLVPGGDTVISDPFAALD